MYLAVVGSTNITDKQRGIASVIIDGFFFAYLPELVISGGALGIDSLEGKGNRMEQSPRMEYQFHGVPSKESTLGARRIQGT